MYSFPCLSPDCVLCVRMHPNCSVMFVIIKNQRVGPYIVLVRMDRFRCTLPLILSDIFYAYPNRFKFLNRVHGSDNDSMVIEFGSALLPCAQRDQGKINEIHDVIILATFTAVPGLPVHEKYKCGPTSD